MSYQHLTMSMTDDPDVDFVKNPTHSRATRKSWFKYSIIEVAVFVICCGISFVLGRQQFEPKARIEVPSLRFESPADQRLVQWNISFSNPSIHRGEPGPAVDAAWEEAEKFNIINASAADLRRTGTNPHAIPLPNEDDRGGGYMASLEVVYHMHCLNFLRKASFVDYEYYKNDPVFEDAVFPVEFRIRMCTDVLRHALACHADRNLMAFYWVQGYPRPYPNLNTWHMCGGYEAMIAETESHRVAPPKSWEDWRAQNVTEFDAPLEAEQHPRPQGL